MEKENPVIKNYILSAERRVIYNDAPSKTKSILHQSCDSNRKIYANPVAPMQAEYIYPFTPGNFRYHELLEQNKGSFYLFP